MLSNLKRNLKRNPKTTREIQKTLSLPSKTMKNSKTLNNSSKIKENRRNPMTFD